MYHIDNVAMALVSGSIALALIVGNKNDYWATIAHRAALWLLLVGSAATAFTFGFPDCGLAWLKAALTGCAAAILWGICMEAEHTHVRVRRNQKPVK